MHTLLNKSVFDKHSMVKVRSGKSPTANKGLRAEEMKKEGGQRQLEIVFNVARPGHRYGRSGHLPGTWTERGPQKR